MPVARFDRINRPHVFTVMLRIRMVRLVHLDSFWVMVDGYINTVSGCHFYTSGSAASTGKIVNYQFSMYHFLQKEPGAPFIRIGPGSFLCFTLFFCYSVFYPSSLIHVIKYVSCFIKPLLPLTLFFRFIPSFFFLFRLRPINLLTTP